QVAKLSAIHRGQSPPESANVGFKQTRLRIDRSFSGQNRPTRGAEAPREPWSIRRIPEDDEPVVALIAGGAGEVGVEPARTELGGGKAERDVLVARSFRAPVPSGADLDVAGIDPVVGLDVVGLAGVGGDGDLGADAEGLELPLEGAVLAGGDISDGRHCASPCLSTGTRSLVDGPTGMAGTRRARTEGRSVSGGPEAARLLLREEPHSCGGEESRKAMVSGTSTGRRSWAQGTGNGFRGSAGATCRAIECLRNGRALQRELRNLTAMQPLPPQA